MSLTFFHMSIGFLSHVDFKKWLCRPVDFKGQGPTAVQHSYCRTALVKTEGDY